MDKEHVFFENYAGTWDRDRKEDKQKLQFLVDLAGIRSGACVLDAGCGTGVLLPYLRNAVGGTGHVEALDYSRQMLEKAQKKFGGWDGISFTLGNMLKYPFSHEAYDAVVCLNVYPHISRHSLAFIKNVRSALTEGGALVIMHDTARQHVNAIHTGSQQPLLPPVDVLASQCISAGFSVAVAMDTEDAYFLKVVKTAELPYSHYGEEDEPAHPSGGHIHHAHSHSQTKVVQNRLARISGHLEAIRRMVEDGRDCSDVLVQLAAVDSAIVSVSKVILKDHIDHCIVDAVRENDMEAVENLKRAISTFVK